MLKNMDCIFCKIVAGAIPSKKLYEDELTYAFADIDAKAPVHALVVPKKHIESLAETGEADKALLGHMLAVTATLAQTLGLKDGYRVVSNIGPDGGQTVSHLHFHLMGGRAMHWPPG